VQESSMGGPTVGDAEELRTAVIVEDDPDLRHLLSSVFESAGFSVVSVGNGIDGVRAALAYEPLITTLDVSMPGIDGYEAARRIRAGGSTTHIIMITAMGEEADIVQGLGAGADDYIVKPFRQREFRARIDAFLRRPRETRVATPSIPRQERAGPSFPKTGTPTTGIPIQAEPQTMHVVARHDTARDDRARDDTAHDDRAGTADTDDEIVIVGEIDEPGTGVERRDPHIGWLRHRDLFLDPNGHRVDVGDTPLQLTPTEFALLHTLMESRRRVRSKADLTLVLRGESYVTSYYVGDADKRAIQSHMDSLRRKLGEVGVPVPRYIEAVRDVGYRLTPEIDLFA